MGRVKGRSRPVAFVEDCVVPPENLPAFVPEFLATLTRHGLEFGIYGHVDVGCLHIRPALNLDSPIDRSKLVAISDEVFDLTRKHGGIFWGEHGKGVRGAYLRDWIGADPPFDIVELLDNGTLELKTNPVENQIRPIALTREERSFRRYEIGAEN